MCCRYRPRVARPKRVLLVCALLITDELVLLPGSVLASLSQSRWWPRGCHCHPVPGGAGAARAAAGAVRSRGSSFPAGSIIPIIIRFLDQGRLLNLAPLALPFRPPALAEGFIRCRRGREIEWKNAGLSPPGWGAGGGARLGLTEGAGPALGGGSDAVSVCPPLCGWGKNPDSGIGAAFQSHLEMVNFFKRTHERLLTGCYFPLALKLKGTLIGLISPIPSGTPALSTFGPFGPNSPSHPILRRFANWRFLLRSFSKFHFIFTKTICQT